MVIHIFLYILYRINWSSLSRHSSSTPIVQTFVDTIQDLYLFQHITEPTHYRHGETPHAHLLYLVFTNEQTMISNIEYLATWLRM